MGRNRGSFEATDGFVRSADRPPPRRDYSSSAPGHGGTGHAHWMPRLCSDRRRGGVLGRWRRWPWTPWRSSIRLAPITVDLETLPGVGEELAMRLPVP